MQITLGYDLIASLHAAAQDAENIGAPGAGAHNLLCDAYGGAHGECTCGIPGLLTGLDEAVSAALLAAVQEAAGLSLQDLAPVLALDVGGLELFRAGWRTSYPHLRVLCEILEVAREIGTGPDWARCALLAPAGAHPTRIAAMLAAYAPAGHAAPLGAPA